MSIGRMCGPGLAAGFQGLKVLMAPLYGIAETITEACFIMWHRGMLHVASLGPLLICYDCCACMYIAVLLSGSQLGPQYCCLAGCTESFFSSFTIKV